LFLIICHYSGISVSKRFQCSRKKYPEIIWCFFQLQTIPEVLDGQVQLKKYRICDRGRK
jgi:hypothetical protein